MIKTLHRIFFNIQNIVYLVAGYVTTFLIFRTSPDWGIYWDFLQLDNFSHVDFWSFFWDKTILSFGTSLFWDNFIAIIVPFLIAVNIVLFKELYQRQKMILKGKSFWASLSGMFFGFFGAGCAACSGILFAPLISALGLTAFFDLFPYKGAEIAYIGIVILIISCFYILKKINEPLTCK